MQKVKRNVIANAVLNIAGSLKRGIVCLIQYVNGTYVSVVAKKQVRHAAN